MDTIPSAQSLIVSGASIARHGYARYPIFSLKAGDAELLQDMRDYLGGVQAEYREVSLPGICGAEIGFVFLGDTRQIGLCYDKMTNALRDNWVGWIFSPALHPIPSDVDVPDSCFCKLADVLQQRADEVECPGPETLYCLNLVTEEVAKVHIDYCRHTYLADRDISGWKQFGVFEGDFVSAHSA